MCLAISGRVIKVEGSMAEVDFGGVGRQVNVSLVDARPGDWVMVHAGFAIQTVDEDEALETLRLWEELLSQT